MRTEDEQNADYVTELKERLWVHLVNDDEYHHGEGKEQLRLDCETCIRLLSAIEFLERGKVRRYRNVE